MGKTPPRFGCAGTDKGFFGRREKDLNVPVEMYSLLRERYYTFYTVCEDSHVNRGIKLSILSIRICTIFEKEPNNTKMPIERGQVQWGVAEGITRMQTRLPFAAL
jgi:hypothetical protein